MTKAGQQVVWNDRCQHRFPDGLTAVEIIHNGLEQPIGEQCRVCLAVLAGYGECRGCKGNGRLTLRIGTDEPARRYHSHECRAAELKAEREAKAKEPKMAAVRK